MTSVLQAELGRVRFPRLLPYRCRLSKTWGRSPARQGVGSIPTNGSKISFADPHALASGSGALPAKEGFYGGSTPPEGTMDKSSITLGYPLRVRDPAVNRLIQVRILVPQQCEPTVKGYR